MDDRNNFQKCDKDQCNVVNCKRVLPIIDGHCHIFGQSLYEGGDVIDLLELEDAWGPGAGIRRFLAYTMWRGRDNARKILGAVPENPTENQVTKQEYAKAIVPLLLDMGYTPLQPLGPKFLDLGYRSQSVKTEAELIAETDQTRVCPDKSGLATLRLESLYCKETEDRTGDDQIRIEVYSGSNLIKVVPTLIVDHNDQTRMINEEVLFDPAAEIQIKLYEVDLDSPDDNLGVRSLAIDKKTSGWKTLLFSGSKDASRGTDYELTYSVTMPDGSGGSQGSSGATKGFVLQLHHLRCIAQEDWTGEDDIRIEVTTSGGTKKFGNYGCQKNSPTGVSKNVWLDSDATVKLWEYDRDSGDDDLGEVKISRKQASYAVATFTGDGAKYELVYSVTPGERGESDDTFYKDDEDYLWFKRDRETFRGTIRSLAQDASVFPGQVWPMVPFDPRRPDGLDYVKEAIEQLGFAGAKLYSRCGWLPTDNRELYGDALGDKLDKRLKAFYDYMTQNDLPILVHCSPTGYPPDGQIVFPKCYYRRQPPTNNVSGLPFPPLSTVGDCGMPGGPRAHSFQDEIKKHCGALAIYCHYVQKTTSPYAWDKVLAQYPKLRLCFGHSGSAAGIYWRYKDSISQDMKADEDDLGDTMEDSDLLEEAIPANPHAGPDDPSKSGEWRFRNRFTDRIVELVYKIQKKMHDSADMGMPVDYRPVADKSAIRKAVEDFFAAGGNATGSWNQWFAAWEKAYPHDWTTKIVLHEAQYANVYADISYLSGEESELFVELLAKLLDDADKGTKNGQAMADKHIVGTDWFMIEIDEMAGEDFWNRVADKKALRLSHKLRTKWITENALNWLNLRDRLGGDGLEKLESFYEANSEKRPPSWWEFLDPYYDEKSGDNGGGSDSDNTPEPKKRKPIPKEWLPNNTEVRILQERLTELGHNPGVIDGLWGPNTKAGLKQFQTVAHLDVDGIYGPKSRAALDQAVNG